MAFVAKFSLPVNIAAYIKQLRLLQRFQQWIESAYKTKKKQIQNAIFEDPALFMRSEVNSIDESDKKIFSDDAVKIALTADGPKEIVQFFPCCNRSLFERWY